MRCLTNSSCQAKIGLFVGSHIKLQRSLPLLSSLANLMNNRWNYMSRTPNAGYHRADFPAHLHRNSRVPARSLDWHYIKPKSVLRTKRTSNMKLGVATWEMTRDACSVRRLAKLARFPIAVPWNKTKPFCWLQFLGDTKFDFRIPDRTINMDPVVAYCPL